MSEPEELGSKPLPSKSKGSKRQPDTPIEELENDLHKKRQKLDTARQDYTDAIVKLEAHPDMQHWREHKRQETRNKEADQLGHQLHVWRILLDKEGVDPAALHWLSADAEKILSRPVSFVGRYHSGRGQGPESWVVTASIEAEAEDESVKVKRCFGPCEVFLCDELETKRLRQAEDAQLEPTKAKWSAIIDGMRPTDIQVAAVFLIVYSTFLPEFQ